MALSIILTVVGGAITVLGGVFSLMENKKSVIEVSQNMTGEYLNDLNDTIMESLNNTSDSEVPDEIPDANYDE